MNMSYCRFQNTAIDLGDCLDTMYELIEKEGKTAYDETLGEPEQRAMENIISMSREILEIEEELMELIEKANEEI